MPGKFLKGALIEFTTSFLVPVPNVIIFQFNPETMTHTWTPAAPLPPPGGGEPNPLAVKGLPGETFSFTLAMDALDTIEASNQIAQGLAATSGIYSRLAALEMLLYPTRDPQGAFVLTAATSAQAGAFPLNGSYVRSVPLRTIPTVLFVWGPGRILPVRVTSLTITEKLYDPLLLHPVYAEAQVGLSVLTEDELRQVDGPLGKLARGAYTYTLGLRQDRKRRRVGKECRSRWSPYH